MNTNTLLRFLRVLVVVLWEMAANANVYSKVLHGKMNELEQVLLELESEAEHG